tara:strand:+ start:1335 stop:2132 length:798 start_codon:yes stop_codon:yes gene_type:complete
MEEVKYLNYKNAIIENPENYNQNDPIDIFSNHKYSKFSQLGEDGVIEFIFSKIEPINKYYVEFGAWDGIHLSNTANLRINHGWSGLLLESNKERVNKTKNRRQINLHSETITKENINNIFEKYNVPKKFDLLSIDIDSNDYYVWKNLTDYVPILVIIETNPGIKNDYPLTAIENKSNTHSEKGRTGNYFGCNLHAVYNLAKKKGYKLLTVNKWNAFFIKDECFDLFGIEEISKEKMINEYSVVNPYWANRNKYKVEPYEWIITQD